jgi:predicted MFS family arabinose efflux permease
MTVAAHKPNLTNATLWIMTLTTGLVVANIYYNQPLLNDMANTYHVSNGKAGQVSMLTQIGYAVGMLFIVPLADMVKRKRLMLIDFAFVIAALLLTALAPNIHILILSGFLLGATSIIPQLLIPMGAHLAKPHERGKKIGFMMSGLLIGILLSRTLSGFIGAHFGWRTMFYIAAAIMIVMWVLIYFLLPEVEPDYKGTYKTLMRSLVHLFKSEPKLQLASLRGALCFACFSAFWTTLVFLLKQQFNQGSDVAGAFGLVGAFGAIVQATHISNQAIIFSLNPAARNRINTIYMVSYFIGGALGTFLATRVWGTYNWAGVCVIGITLSVITIIIHLLTRKTMQRTV